MADTKVPADPGAGVGKSGVVTPWENLNDQRSDFMNMDKKLGPSNMWEEGNRKEGNVGGLPQHKNPWDGKCTAPGENNDQSY